mgnify:CR=1 FL=1
MNQEFLQNLYVISLLRSLFFADPLALHPVRSIALVEKWHRCGHLDGLVYQSRCPQSNSIAHEFRLCYPHKTPNPAVLQTRPQRRQLEQLRVQPTVVFQVQIEHLLCTMFEDQVSAVNDARRIDLDGTNNPVVWQLEIFFEMQSAACLKSVITVASFRSEHKFFILVRIQT